MARPKKTARKTQASSAGTRASRKKSTARKRSRARAKKTASSVARKKKPVVAPKKKKAAKRPERRAEALPRAGDAPVLIEDQMSFEVRWLGGAQARLTSLLDNQKPIEQFPSGSSPLTVSFSVPAALTHTIQWDVLAPGQELLSITAKAKRNGESLRELNRADSAKDRWQSSGILS